MIVIKIQGRLGNQMFQYAFAKRLQKEFYPNEEIIINYSKSKYSNKCAFCENNNFFNLKTLKSTYKMNINILQRLLMYSYILIKRIFKIKRDIKFQNLLNYFGIYFLQDAGICNFKKSKMKNKIIYGYFASEKFFELAKEEVLNDYKFEIELDKEKEDFLKKIRENNSICISIRRGDYLESINKDYFYVCDKQYYLQAIEKANKCIENPLYVVFSDDIEWVKKNIKINKKCIYEDKNNKVNETLYFMKNCKNFIISNSTFHWWAQYLAENKEKKVYAPSIWNNLDLAREIYQDNWNLIEVKRKNGAGE